MKVFLDAGHGGKDPGAVSGNLTEKNMTLICANAVKDFLVKYGVEVKLSRTKDTYLSLSERATMANNWGADFFVSCHFNAGGGDRGETIHSVFAGKGKELAEEIAGQLKAIGQQTVRVYSKTASSGYGDYYTVIANTKMPAVIVEPCFIDSADRELADTEDEQRCIGVVIAKGILDYLGIQYEEVPDMAQTVMKLPEEVYIQEINPADFDIVVCNCKKRVVNQNRYFNAGFFAAQADGSTVPVGNLAGGGRIIAQAKDNPDWINVAGKALTTIYTTKDGTCGLAKTDSLSAIQNLQAAISGIPIIVGGKYVPYEDITAEGYFGSELYDTWHGFLGIRHNKLVYVAMKCGFEAMCWAMVALGIYDAIKLDGGGSFILHDVKELVGTGENRRIHNVGVWL